jgi:hypothetical protein
VPHLRDDMWTCPAIRGGRNGGIAGPCECGADQRNAAARAAVSA